MTRGRVALGILAGGQARRLGGVDKAQAIFEGQTLLARTLAAAGDGFAQILLSHSNNKAVGADRVITDLRPEFPGPLAGVEALLAAAETDWLLTMPVDLARLPGELFERLAAVCDGEHGVAARDAEGGQPLVALWPVEASRTAVGAALDAGERAVHRVQQTLAFSQCELAPLRLGNLNSPADFEARA